MYLLSRKCRILTRSINGNNTNLLKYGNIYGNNIVYNFCGLIQKQKNGGSKVNLKDGVNDIEFIQHRIKVFDDIYNEQENERKNLPKNEINIEMPDGSIKKGLANETTPMDIANGISKGLAKKAVVAQIKTNDDGKDSDGICWDLLRPLEKDCELKILTFDDPKGKETFWHSSSHVLGQSMERYVNISFLI